MNFIARLTKPPSLCPFVYITIACDLRNGTNMAVYLSLLLVHNHVNGITSNSDSNNIIFLVNFTPYSHVIILQHLYVFSFPQS